MGPQELCLVSENMGHRYMAMFDEFHPEVRARLRTCKLNLCVACIDEHAGKDPQIQLEMIHQIERGTFNADNFAHRRGLGTSARSYREEARLRRLYEPAYYPSVDLDNSDWRESGDLGDAFARSFQPWFSERGREYRYYIPQGDIRPSNEAADALIRIALNIHERKVEGG